MTRTSERFDNVVLKDSSLKSATITRVNHQRGFGFLRGDNEDHDTFFHANVVRFTEGELKKIKKTRKLDQNQKPLVDAFSTLEEGMRVLYLPATMTKDGKGPRARWVGVGDQR
jgi:cold shock CspA family protein